MTTTADAFFGGRIGIRQDSDGYRFSIDAVILAAHTNPRPTDRIVDLGTGCGVIALMLAYRHPETRIWAVEVQPELAEMARRNVVENGMASRITVLEQDLTGLAAGMVGGPVDLVVSNPPYRKSRSGRLNPERQKAVARHEIRATLADVLQSARRILKRRGRFVAVYPAERLVDMIAQMRVSGIEPKRVRMVHSDRCGEARLFLVEGVSGGKPGVKVAAPLFIYSRRGVYCREVQRMFAP